MSGFTEITGMRVTLELLTISSTLGSISAYKMIQAWNKNSLWNDFGGDGVQPDGVDAATDLSFRIHRPQSGSLVTMDVTADVMCWLSGEPNEGW